MTDPVTACVKCFRNLWHDEIAAGRIACFRCESAAVERLRALPAMFKRLDTASALIKGRGGDLGGGSPSSNQAPVRIGPLNETASGGTVTRLQAITDAWYTALGFEHGSSLRPNQIDEAIKPIINNLRWACERYEEVAEDLGVIDRLHGTLRSLDTGEPAPFKFTVYCDEPTCAGGMRITLNSERARCSNCGRCYEKDELGFLDSEFGPNPSRNSAAA